MKQLKLISVMLSVVLTCSACSNYNNRSQSANLGLCKKIRLELNTETHFHNPNATHNTHINRVMLMRQYEELECPERMEK